MTVYKDLKQPIGLRMEAAKAALPYEKPRLASIENKIVDEFDNMTDEQVEAWLDERAQARVKKRHRISAEVQRRGGIETLRPTTTSLLDRRINYRPADQHRVRRLRDR